MEGSLVQKWYLLEEVHQCIISSFRHISIHEYAVSKSNNILRIIFIFFHYPAIVKVN